MGVGLGRLGQGVAERARVDAVADVVALAAVTTDRTGAAEVARRNGASVVELDQIDDTVVVVVESSGFRSTAAARAAR